MLLAWTNTAGFFFHPWMQGIPSSTGTKQLKLWVRSSRMRYHPLISLSGKDLSKGTLMNSSKWKAREGMVTLPLGGEGQRIMQYPCGRSEHPWMFWPLLPLAHRWGWHSWWHDQPPFTPESLWRILQESFKNNYTWNLLIITHCPHIFLKESIT